MRRIVADVIALLEKDAVIQTKGEPDGRPYLMEVDVELKITDPRDGGSVQRFPVEDDEQVIGEVTLSWENEGFEVEVERMEEEVPSLKKRPLSEILDEIESRISPEIRELEVRDGEIVRKKTP